MKRIAIEPRNNWENLVTSQGLIFHSRPRLYWNESACYEFTPEETERLEKAGNEVQVLCLQAVQWIIDNDLFYKLAIPEAAKKLIIDSWNKKEPTIYGRFDFTFDGKSDPKLYEYNADTPTILLESAVIQWYWLQERFPKNDQFNSIHEHLISRWNDLNLNKCYFTALNDFEEDVITVEYLRDTASQAGINTYYIDLEDVGYHSPTQTFRDLENQPIDNLFKLYPWEWMIHEEFGRYMGTAGTQFIEPAWKMLLSNKAILPLLWELNPGHPNLLPTFFEKNPELGDSWVRKPFFSREGHNVYIHQQGKVKATQGEYGKEGCIYQKFHPLPDFQGKHPMIGLWMIGHQCRGFGIREDTTLITKNNSQFIPHYIS